MSKLKMDRKPPLPKSPIRLRPRRVLRSNSTSLQTPPGSLTKSQKPSRTWDSEELDLRPEYRSISCELRALAKMVHKEIGNDGDGIESELGKEAGSNSSALFERGRFYDEYSARRNERLKRKKGVIEGNVEGKMVASTPYNLGVIVDSSKRRDSKKTETLRKSMSAAYSVEMTPRYSLRSMSKENKKPPLSVSSSMNSMSNTTYGYGYGYGYEKSVLPSERKIGARRVRKL